MEAFAPPVPLNLRDSIKNVNFKMLAPAAGSTTTVPAGKIWRLLGIYLNTGASATGATFNGVAFGPGGTNISYYYSSKRRLIPYSTSLVVPIYFQPMLNTGTPASPTPTANFFGSGPYYGIGEDDYVLCMSAGQQIVTGASSTLYAIYEEIDE